MLPSEQKQSVIVSLDVLKEKTPSWYWRTIPSLRYLRFTVRYAHKVRYAQWPHKEDGGAYRGGGLFFSILFDSPLVMLGLPDRLLYQIYFNFLYRGPPKA